MDIGHQSAQVFGGQLAAGHKLRNLLSGRRDNQAAGLLPELELTSAQV
jgi:hypothetical protein